MSTRLRERAEIAAEASRKRSEEADSQRRASMRAGAEAMLREKFGVAEFEEVGSVSTNTAYLRAEGIYFKVRRQDRPGTDGYDVCVKSVWRGWTPCPSLRILGYKLKRGEVLECA